MIKRFSSLLISLLLLWLSAAPADAQDFTPPEAERGARRSTRLGLFGFGARLGADFTDENQAVVGITLDLGDLLTDRIRFRPSGEIGFGAGRNTFIGSWELMYRFTPDTAMAIPYIGFGIGVWGRDGCGPDPDCPELWPLFALGFELKYKSTFNWLIEYHGEDALRRHRFFIGLTTRRRP